MTPGLDCVYLEYDFVQGMLNMFSNFSEFGEDLEELIESGNYEINAATINICFDDKSDILGVEASSYVEAMFEVSNDGKEMTLEFDNPVLEWCFKTLMFRKG